MSAALSALLRSSRLFKTNIDRFDDHHPGLNGLYGGQLQPLLAFAAALLFVRRVDVPWEESSGSNAEGHHPGLNGLYGGQQSSGSSALCFGICTRLLALCFGVTFASLRPQVVAIAGRRGLYPAAPMLARAAREIHPRWRRRLMIPALHLRWFGCSDRALVRTCDAGVICAALALYGLIDSTAALAGCWLLLVSLSAVVPMIGYPWDLLLLEAGLWSALLLPPLAPLHASLACVAPPSWVAIAALRLLLVRVMVGMGKFKFSRGWTHRANRDYLKWFLSWQPLPTPLARRLYLTKLSSATDDCGHWPQRTRLRERAFDIALACVYVVEVLLPAAYFADSAWLRVPAAAATIALQVGIQLSGNYGVFNLATAALAVPLFAPTTSAAAAAPSAAAVGLLALYAFLSLLHFPHNSYTTQAWPFAVSSDMVDRLPPPLRPPARALLALARALAPWHVCHAWGVFTPLSPFYCTDSRPLLDILVSSDGKKWRPLLGRYHADAHGLGLAGTRSGRHPTMRALRWFAPHQPRLDHHLFYEAMRIDLAETTLLNPYHAYGAGLLPRLAHRLMEWEPSVLALLEPRGVRGARACAPPTHVAFVRRWARFATDEEGLAAGAWRPAPGPPNLRGEAPVYATSAELYTREVWSLDGGPVVAGRAPVEPPPLRAACRESDGWWAEFANAQPAPLRRGSFDLFAHPAAEEACLYTKRELTLEDDAEELAALRKWHVCRVE